MAQSSLALPSLLLPSPPASPPLLITLSSPRRFTTTSFSVPFLTTTLERGYSYALLDVVSTPPRRHLYALPRGKLSSRSLFYFIESQLALLLSTPLLQRSRYPLCRCSRFTIFAWHRTTELDSGCFSPSILSVYSLSIRFRVLLFRVKQIRLNMRSYPDALLLDECALRESLTVRAPSVSAWVDFLLGGTERLRTSKGRREYVPLLRFPR